MKAKTYEDLNGVLHYSDDVNDTMHGSAGRPSADPAIHDHSSSVESGPIEVSEADIVIIREVGRLLAEVESLAMPGETADFLYHVHNGAVQVSGPTNSATLYQRLLDAVLKLKAVQGVKSVDIGGVRRP